MSENHVYNMDCLDGMKLIADHSIDMILCDLPYEVTNRNEWDSLIPFEPLWDQYNRIIKDTGAILFTAIQPFTTKVVQSNFKAFKYEWIWQKSTVNGFLNAKKQPLRIHEQILVFYNKQPTYNPQGIRDCYNRNNGTNSLNYGINKASYNQTQTNYPKSILNFISESSPLHPTQKPLKLFEYLIKTYTNSNDIVLDPTMGSGTTAEACMNTGRRYIGFEKDVSYYQIIQERLHKNCRKLDEWAQKSITDEAGLARWAVSDMM